MSSTAFPTPTVLLAAGSPLSSSTSPSATSAGHHFTPPSYPGSSSSTTAATSSNYAKSPGAGSTLTSGYSGTPAVIASQSNLTSNNNSATTNTTDTTTTTTSKESTASPAVGGFFTSNQNYPRSNSVTNQIYLQPYPQPSQQYYSPSSIPYSPPPGPGPGPTPTTPLTTSTTSQRQQPQQHLQNSQYQSSLEEEKNGREESMMVRPKLEQPKRTISSSSSRIKQGSKLSAARAVVDDINNISESNPSENDDDDDDDDDDDNDEDEDGEENLMEEDDEEEEEEDNEEGADQLATSSPYLSANRKGKNTPSRKSNTHNGQYSGSAIASTVSRSINTTARAKSSNQKNSRIGNEEVDEDSDMDERIQAKGKTTHPYKNGHGSLGLDSGHNKPKGKSPGGKRTIVDKKKKAGRACAACQKAHLTCDDARPCARCVKKGCPELCHDGARKKAKYLQEIPDELLERRPQANEQVKIESPPIVPDGGLESEDSPDHLPLADNQSQPFVFDTLPYYDTSAFSNEFGSEAANLEYAILSSMLNGNGFSVDNNYNGIDQQQQTEQQDPRLTVSANGSTMLINSPLASTLTLGGGGPTPVASGVGSGYGPSPSMFDRRLGESSMTSPATGFAMSPTRLQDTAQDLFPVSHGSSGLKPDLSSMRSTSGEGFGMSSSSTKNTGATSMSGGIDYNDTKRQSHDQLQQPMGDYGSTSGTDQSQQQQQNSRPVQPARALTGEEAYRNVTKPYPYAQSYHYLVGHLKERFEKNDILRIIRALATFRPSLIALQMPLTEEDETFVERTFQRTLVELNKLISFSGTPTVVWRRTGEICLVGTEFCLLTGWTREELLGKKYIFELFDTASVVEYYEAFAKHAFESTSSSVMTQCVVLGPSGRPVPCAFCFSVRRDLFSVGSFDSSP